MSTGIISIVVLLILAIIGVAVYFVFFTGTEEEEEEEEEEVDCTSVESTDTSYDENALTYTYDSTLSKCVPSTCKYNYEVDSTNNKCILKQYIDGPVFSATGNSSTSQIGLYDNEIFGYALKYPFTDYTTSENEILFSMFLYQPNMTYGSQTYYSSPPTDIGEKFGSFALIFPNEPDSNSLITYVSADRGTFNNTVSQFYNTWRTHNNTARFYDWILEKIPNTEYYYLKTGTRNWISGTDNIYDERRPRGKYVYYHIDNNDILNNGFAIDTTGSGKKSKFRIDTVDESVAKQVLSQAQINTIVFHETLPKFFRLVMVITNPECQENEVYKLDIDECVTEDRTSNDIKNELNSPPNGYSFVYMNNPLTTECELTNIAYKLSIPGKEVTLGPNADTLSGVDALKYGTDFGKLTIDECGTLCNSNTQCVGFTYHLGSSQPDTGGTCFLRKEKIKPRQYNNLSNTVGKACLAKNTHIEQHKLTNSDGSYEFPS